MEKDDLHIQEGVVGGQTAKVNTNHTAGIYHTENVRVQTNVKYKTADVESK